MRTCLCRGHTLAELLVAMGLAALIGTIVLPAVFVLQARGLAEVSRNDLQTRAGRLLRFLGHALRSTAFLIGAAPVHSGGTPPVIVQDSLAGDPVVTLAWSLLSEDGGEAHDDLLTIVTAKSFFPPLRLAAAAPSGATSLRLDRSPNQPPGSSREIRPAPEATSHVVLANQRNCYPVGTAGQILELLDPLAGSAPAATELLGLRIRRFHRDSAGRLRRDDFTSDEILNAAVDVLQFQYLLADGRIVDWPADIRAVRAIRLSLLVRALHPDRDYRDRASYRLGNRSYGPYHDHFRRVMVSEMVEMNKHALP